MVGDLNPGSTYKFRVSPRQSLSSYSRLFQGYTVEFNEVGLEYWQAAIPYVPNTSQVVGDLNPGSTYQFRVSANNKVGMSEPSVPSDYVMIPTESGKCLSHSISLLKHVHAIYSDFSQ